MKEGRHGVSLAAATEEADQVFWYEPPGLLWPLTELVAKQTGQSVWQHIDTLIDAVVGTAKAGDAVVVMSNGGFGGIHEKLLQRLGKTEDVG